MKKTLVTLTGRILAVLVVAATWSLPAASAAEQATYSLQTQPLQARVQTPEYTVTATGVEVPGYAKHVVPGAPSLPLYGLTLELPAAGAWDLTFESTGSRILPERVTIAAAPVPNLNLPSLIAPDEMAALPSSVPVVDRPDPAIYDVDAFFPASPVVAGEVVLQGGRRILPVRVFPFQYNPVTRQLRYHPDLLVKVQVTDGGSQPAAVLQPESFYAPISRLPGDGVLRIHTREPGLYRLTYAELSAAGVPVGAGGANPSTFAVYYKGQQVHIDVTGADDGAFNSDDLVIFYAVPYDGGRYQNYNVYQFAYGGGVAGQRMAVRAVAAPAVSPATSIITQTLHVELDRVYFTNLNRPNDADHFFDNAIYPNSTTPSVTRSYDLALSSPVTSTGSVQISALFMGAFNQTANPDQSVLLRLNNRDVSLHQWDGLAEHLVNTSAPAAWLDGVPNQLQLVGAVSQLPGVTYYSIYPDWVDVTYSARANAQGDRLVIPELAGPASSVAAGGFSSPLVSAIDVRNPAQPQRLSGFGVEDVAGSYKVYWEESVDNPTYALSTAAGLRAPGAIEPDAPSNWASTDNAYNYVAIIGAERSYNGTTALGDQLQAALQPLVAHRTSDGFSVAQVRVQDIYDEWSYGRIDPMAIRSFLSYAYFHWDTPPHYVMLIGDGHYDYNKVTSQPLPNLLPPYLANVDPWWGEVPTDNLYVSVDGPGDYLPDMAVGRLPVNYVADVTAMVDKILAYESPGLNPDGAWQQRAVYEADDCDDSAGDFHVLSDQGRLGWLAPGYSSQKIYFDNPNIAHICPEGTHNDRFQVRAAVRQAYNDGAFYLQWFGHGSQVRWGGAASLFQANDLPNLNTNTRYPLSTANACLTGYFIWNSPYSPYPYTQSLAEIMVITPQRGSIVDLSPSGLHVGSALMTLQKAMHMKLFDERIARAGDVVDAAKWYFFQNSFAYHDVIDTMVYFGDPALKLRYPTSDLSASTMQVDQSTATLGATLNYTLTLNNSSTFAASSLKAVVDYPQDMVTVADAGGAVDNGDTLVWPLLDVPAGGQLARTFALNVAAAPAPENFDLVVPAIISSPVGPDGVPVAPSVNLDVLTQILTAPDAVMSALDTSRAWAPPGFPITATMTISHADGLPAPGVQVTMTLPSGLGAPTWLYASNSVLVYDPQAHRIAWTGDAPAGGPATLAWSSVISSTVTACSDLLVDAAVNYNGVLTPHTATISLAAPDIDCSGNVTVADVQQAAARWGAPAGDPLYHPRYDLNADDVIDVLDLTIAAQAWN